MVEVRVVVDPWEDNGMLFAWFDPIDRGTGKGNEISVKRWRGGEDIFTQEMTEVMMGMN